MSTSAAEGLLGGAFHGKIVDEWMIIHGVLLATW